jgi:hypothetical protein
MDRIPKYTAGMFKKKMPRFGASAIKKPRLPLPPKPRVKKFQAGGDTNDLVPRSMLPDESAAQLAARTRGSKGPEKRFRNRSDLNKSAVEESIVSPKSYFESLSPQEQKKMFEEYKRKMAEEKRKAEEERKKDREAGEMIQRQDRLFNEQVRRDIERRRRGILTARGGGVMKSSHRGDGIAKKGKTRGKFV